MDAKPVPDVPADRWKAIAILKAYLARLNECQTVAARDRRVAGLIEHIAAIIGVHSDLEQAWLLGMDRINKRFQVRR
jgi:hypothetical protein